MNHDILWICIINAAVAVALRIWSAIEHKSTAKGIDQVYDIVNLERTLMQERIRILEEAAAKLKYLDDAILWERERAKSSPPPPSQ